MLLDLGDLRVRSWRKNDLDALVRYANNPTIAANLRDQFPHPYTRSAGAAYLAEVRSAEIETSFAVEYADEAVGGIGFKLGADIARLSAEMGYWLGEPYWGRGLTTRAVLATSEWAFENYKLTRIFAMAPSTIWDRCACWRKRVSSAKGFCGAALSKTASSSTKCYTPRCGNQFRVLATGNGEAEADSELMYPGGAALAPGVRQPVKTLFAVR